MRQSAVTVCIREGLSYAGSRSARLAVILFRQNRVWSRRARSGRLSDGMRGRALRLAGAYLAAMEAEQPTPSA